MIRLRMGFTLVEVMIVVAILGILATIAVPAIVRSQQKTPNGLVAGTANPVEDYSAAGKVLAGQHELNKMFGPNKDKYFDQGPGVTHDGKTFDCYKFFWKTNTGGFVVSLLPTTKFHVVFEDFVDPAPYIKFRWKKNNNTTDTAELMDDTVIYAEVHCKREDWIGTVAK